MKRGLKIGLVSVGTLVALVVVAVCLVCWLVFTPARLTGVVNKIADKYLACEMTVGKIDLTLFSSFPDVALELTDVTLVNPMEGAPSDTVAAIPHCQLVVDMDALMDDGTVILKSLALHGGWANLYTDAECVANFMVFPLDTVAEEPVEDTATWKLPDIDIKELDIRDLRVDYHDVPTGQKAAVEGLNACINGQMTGQQLMGTMTASLRKVTAAMEGENAMNACAENISLDLNGELRDAGAKAKVTLKVGRADAAMADMTARVEELEWSLHGDGNEETWKGYTALTTQPMEVKMGGENPAEAMSGSIGLKADVAMQGKEITLKPALTMPALTVSLGGERMLSDAHIQLQGALRTDTSLQQVGLNEGLLALNEYEIKVSGQVQMPDTSTVNADVDFETNRWDVGRLLSLVPRSYQHLLEGIAVSGGVALRGSGDVSLAGGEAHIGAVQATVSMDNMDLLYNDSIALKSNRALLDMTYDGRRDYAKGGMIADMLHVAMTGMADAQLDEVKGDFSLRKAMMMTDGFIDAKAHVSMAALAASMDTLELSTQNASMDIHLYDDERETPQFDVALHVDTMHTAMGALMAASTRELGIKAQAVYDESATDLLSQWNPRLDIDMQHGDVNSSMLTVPVAIPHIQFDYADGHFTVNDSRILLGNSDFGLRGDIHNIDSFVNKTGLLKAELDFSSAYTDVTQLMDLVSGLGSNDSTEVEEVTDETTMNAEEDDPFMVPLGMDVRLNTDIHTANVNGFKFDDIGGHVMVKDGVLVLEEMGFTADAARMQLTAMYKSPRKNHLFVGFDFHLLDIEIDELIHMIPDVDSIIPMLSAFDGEAQFHFAAETYLKSNYDIKMSTLRAAGAIEGKDLVVMDNETFAQISKYLLFEKTTENVVDSISVELTVFKDEVDLYPFLIAMDDYKAVIGGRHNIDENLSFDYHISLTDCPLPVRLGLDISGSLDDMKFKPVACKYAHMYNPKKQNVVQARTLQLKKIISESLKDNVKPQEKRVQE